MTEGKLDVRTQANIKSFLQRYMIVLMQRRREEDDPLSRDFLSAEMMELDDWYCSFVDDEGVSLFDLAERRL